MSGLEPTAAGRIPAIMIIHQEGVIALIAVIALSFRKPGLLAGLAPKRSFAEALLVGVGIGLVCFAVLWLIRGVGPLADLENWQRRMVHGWTKTDTASVAVFSGLAEEAFIRAFLQPLVGLLPAAAVFAVLHIVPERRLWLWPVVALGMGLFLGWGFSYGGYPTAAAAHVVINALSLVRLRDGSAE